MALEEASGQERKIDIAKVQRNILADKPRVTRYQIPWDGEEEKYARDGEEEKYASAMDENSNISNSNSNAMEVS